MRKFHLDQPSASDGKMVVHLSVAELRQLIADEITAALQNCGARAPEKDRLLTTKEAAEIFAKMFDGYTGMPLSCPSADGSLESV